MISLKNSLNFRSLRQKEELRNIGRKSLRINRSKRYEKWMAEISI